MSRNPSPLPPGYNVERFVEWFCACEINEDFCNRLNLQKTNIELGGEGIRVFTEAYLDQILVYFAPTGTRISEKRGCAFKTKREIRWRIRLCTASCTH